MRIASRTQKKIASIPITSIFYSYLKQTLWFLRNLVTIAQLHLITRRSLSIAERRPGAVRAADQANAPTATQEQTDQSAPAVVQTCGLHASSGDSTDCSALCDTARHTKTAMQAGCDDMTAHTMASRDKKKRPCASLHTAVAEARDAHSAHAASDHRLNRTTPARYGTSAATASPRPSRPDANSGSPCAACARDAASGWWRDHRCWSAR